MLYDFPCLVFLKYISDRFTSGGSHRGITAPEVRRLHPRREARRFLEDRDEYASQRLLGPRRRPMGVDPGQGQAAEHRPGRRHRDGPDREGEPSHPRRPAAQLRTRGPRQGPARPAVDLIGSIGFTETDDHGSDDVLGRVYEYFLGQFAGKETGKDAGAFYTPRSVVKTLVEMLEPFKGRVYDPACGSGGMFVESAEFVKAHGGKRTDISVYGQEFTDTTWKLAKMNLALRGIEADLGERSADSFTQDLHPDLRADFVLANPPFNVCNWWDAKLADDPRWKYGTPPQGNANFAWVQHFIYHLSPKGTAGFVLANGSLMVTSIAVHAVPGWFLKWSAIAAAIS